MLWPPAVEFVSGSALVCTTAVPVILTAACIRTPVCHLTTPCSVAVTDFRSLSFNCHGQSGGNGYKL